MTVKILENNETFFSDRGLNCNKMMFIENDQTISGENTRFFIRKVFYKKMSLKNPKTLRKC